MSSLQANGSLSVIKDKVSPNLEVASILYSLQNRALLFENIAGSSTQLAGNLYTRRENLELGLRLKNGSLSQTIEDAIRNPLPSKGHLSSYKEFDWSYSGEADLTKIPVLKHFSKEAGSYLTAGIVVAKFPNSDWENLSFHRMLVLSKNKVAARIVPRHLGQIGRDSSEKKVPVSIIIGPPPSVFISASLQVEYGLSEYRIANKLSRGTLELTTSESSDIAVPQDSEIIFEGHVNFDDLSDEGPFVDLTGTYDEVRKQPVITLEKMRFRKDSVYQAVVASTLEHSIFMGLPQELKIREALSRSIPGFRGINLTPSSGGYFHCIVSIDKGNDGDGKTAILNCFAASHPLKLVIAVDSDVDPSDLAQVEWALTTRFQADSGVVVLKGARGSSLDPSSGKSAVTSKLGLDATLPIKQTREKFERAKISGTPNVESILSAFNNDNFNIRQF
ncbi:MAG: UbiD family decarboxylase [Nitrososphaerales archaeon]